MAWRLLSFWSCKTHCGVLPHKHMVLQMILIPSFSSKFVHMKAQGCICLEMEVEVKEGHKGDFKIQIVLSRNKCNLILHCSNWKQCSTKKHDQAISSYIGYFFALLMTFEVTYFDFPPTHFVHSFEKKILTHRRIMCILYSLYIVFRRELFCSSFF